MNLSWNRHRFPSTFALLEGRELDHWVWTYRVWNGWRAMMRRRNEMRPGEMFVLSNWPTRYGEPPRSFLLVVIDDKNEIEFWRGHAFIVGDAAPGRPFEVVA